MNSSMDAQPVEASHSSTDKPATTPSEGLFERLLDRYITVWMWSVLFGASTGLIFNLISYRTDSRWGLFNGLLLFVLLISLVAALKTWRMLLRCMSVYLIPKFILHKFNENPSSTSDKNVSPQQSLGSAEREAESKAADALRQAFESLVIGAVARIVVTVIEMIFASLSRF
jgi:hypothetical protein